MMLVGSGDPMGEFGAGRQVACGRQRQAERASVVVRQCILFSQRVLANKRFSGGAGTDAPRGALLLTQWIMQADL